MNFDELATKSDIARLETKIEQLWKKRNEIAKQAYSKKEVCTILNISMNKLNKLEEKGKITAGDYLGEIGKSLYKRSAIERLLNELHD